MPDHDGKPIRTTERIDHRGVHPKNRGGLYPAGVRCMALCQDVMGARFVTEEFNHGVVVVKEPPAEVIRSRGTSLVSGSTYNVNACSKDELLSTCGQVLSDDVRSLMLAHNPMMLVARAFLTHAQ